MAIPSHVPLSGATVRPPASEPRVAALPVLGARASREVYRDRLVGRIRVTLPSGTVLGDLSRRHPDATIQILDRLPMGDGQTFLVRFEADGIPPEAVEEELGSDPGVHEVWLAGTGPGRRCSVIRARAPPYMPTIERFSVLRWLPMIIRNGTALWTLLCPRAEWAPFLKDLRSRVPAVEVLALGTQTLQGSDGPLTPRQAEVYRLALLEGYYEYPRRISMSALAERLHCSKSSLFEVLARAERKMLRTDLSAYPSPVLIRPARRDLRWAQARRLPPPPA